MTRDLARIRAIVQVDEAGPGLAAAPFYMVDDRVTSGAPIDHLIAWFERHPPA